MAIFEVSDITSAHLKRFPAEALEPYVLEAIDEFKDLANDRGVLEDEIAEPVSSTAKSFMNYFATYRFAEDSIGVTNVEITEDDVYVRMSEKFYGRAEKKRSELSPEIIRGTAGAITSARAVFTGKLIRTS